MEKLSPPTLDYAPPLRWHGQWRWRIFLLLTLLFAGVVAYLYGPRSWRQVRVLYLQTRCLHYQPPPGQIVYERIRVGQTVQIKSNVTSSKGLGYIPPAWSEFYTEISPPTYNLMGTVFVGQLKKPDGTPRLVAIDFVDNIWPDGIDFQTRVFQLGTTRSDAKELNAGRAYAPSSVVGLGRLDDVPFRLFAATIDPADPSHFTFQTTRGGKQTIFDGRLGADDHVMIRGR